MYNREGYNIPKQAGWICPICGRVMAPTMVECIYCNSKTVIPSTKTTTTTNLNRVENETDTTSLAKEDSGVKTECKCHKDKRLNEVADSIIEPTIMIRKIDENGNIVDKENMTKDELKKMDSILETVLGNLIDRL